MTDRTLIGLILVICAITLYFAVSQYHSGVVFLGGCPDCRKKKAEAEAEAEAEAP
jgi:hypothetical protein